MDPGRYSAEDLRGGRRAILDCHAGKLSWDKQSGSRRGSTTVSVDTTAGCSKAVPPKVMVRVLAFVHKQFK